MSLPSLQLSHERGRFLEIRSGGGMLLLRYVYESDTPEDESPRPYAHPVCSLSGDLVTNFRPNDHAWHHALSLTLTSVDGVNFWGGPSYRAEDGYRPRGDHGRQAHRGWDALSPERMEERVDWLAGGGGTTLLTERRILAATLVEGGWSLRWTSLLTNVSGRELKLGNYHSNGGLVGSHYTGLQFRGARDLLDQHGDAGIGLRSEAGGHGEAGVHGVPARWVEWSCQHDGTLRRTRIRFENLTGVIPWFVREKNPLLAFAFHTGESHALRAGDTLTLDHRLSFTSP